MGSQIQSPPAAFGRSVGLTFLIDTNILIAIEDHSRGGHLNGVEANNFASLAAKHGFLIAVADGSRKDFLRAAVPVRDSRLVQLARYHLLASVAPTEDQRLRAGVPTSASPNDQCDLEILCALDNHAAHYLVTEDVKLRQRAAAAGLADRALSLAEALLLLRALSGEPTRLPSVDTVAAYQVPVSAPILDSIRPDYLGFDEWWAKVQEERREVLIVGACESPDAICVLKVEAGAPSNVGAPTSLKLCTFKVAEHAPGKKLGELLLKAAVEAARRRGVDAIFFTVLPTKTDMLAFAEKFGFLKVQGAATGVAGELVLEKVLIPHGAVMPPLEHAIAYGPGEARAERAHIVPILPRYADELFPEASAYVGLGLSMPTRACGNAIRKAYLSNSPSRRVGRGDLLAFYRSAPERAVIATGVAEATLASTSVAELVQFVGTRSVYTVDEVAELASQGEVLAIRFRFDRVVSDPVGMMELGSIGVLKSPPQSIVQVVDGKVDTLCLRVLT
jgi:ribosomal protein S18 acetylase RimI-like enzyme